MKNEQIRSNEPEATFADLAKMAAATQTVNVWRETAKQLQRDLLGVKAERDAIKFQRESELKSIAEKLGTTVSVENCLGSIDGLNSLVKGAEGARDDWKKQAKAYQAYQAQGFFGRLFGRAPRPWEG